MSDKPESTAIAPATTGPREPVRIHIRWMIRRDLPEVLEIEQAGFNHPWTEEEFLRCLRERNCIGMVAEHGEAVVGFMIYEMYKDKLHILNFAVHPAFRRLEVGKQMIAKMVSKLSSHRRTRITLEVSETNLPAQLFFRSLGFRASAIPTEDRGPSEPTIHMQFVLASAVDFAPDPPTGG